MTTVSCFQAKMFYRIPNTTTNGANVHSWCAVILLKNHDPNLYVQGIKINDKLFIEYARVRKSNSRF